MIKYVWELRILHLHRLEWITLAVSLTFFSVGTIIRLVHGNLGSLITGADEFSSNGRRTASIEHVNPSPCVLLALVRSRTGT